MKPWPGGGRGLLGPRPPRHMQQPPAAAAPAGAVAAAGSRSVLSLWRHHMQSDAKGKGQVRACNVRANCPHSVLHSVRRGKGQGREGEVGQARSKRGLGDERGPRGTSGEGERRERTGNTGKRAKGARVGEPGAGEDQGTIGTHGAGAERGREERERGCHAHCSAPCAYRGREQEEGQSLNTGGACGQPEER